jgi:tRNA nucleotidyltransferase (CCA-adding enzyme)
LEKGVLRCVGNPDRRFAEDALRLIRALRIINVLNCRLNTVQILHDIDIEAETRKSIKKNYYHIQYIAKERIKDEILKVFNYHNPFGFVALLEES